MVAVGAPQISGSGAVATLRVSPAPTDRYSLAGGCYALRSPSGGRLVATASGGGYAASAAQPGDAYALHMQATAPGEYLLYGADTAFVTADAQGGVTGASAASDSAVWRVDSAGAGVF